MSSIIFWGAVIIGGSFLYIGMGGQPSKKEQKEQDRKSTRLNSSHITRSRMPSSA